MDVIQKPLPYTDPVTAFAPHAGLPFAQLLHASPGAGGDGRYSVIALDPFDTLVSTGATTCSPAGELEGSPFDHVEDRLDRWAIPETSRHDTPLIGGAIGYFAYDLVHHLETIAPKTDAGLGTPDMCVGFYDVIAVFDHQAERAWITSTGWPEETSAGQTERAKARAAWLEEQLTKRAPRLDTAFSLSPPKSNKTREAYIQMIGTVIDKIYAGDIYQANVSQRFQSRVAAHVDPFTLFERLLRINPVSYAAYGQFPDIVVASVSPERFLNIRVENNRRVIETRPIKGTRPRGSSEREDEDLKAELLNSEKDRAENMMIVDLMRNDLSKVSEVSSIQVDKLCALESYASVHHLVSTVSGTLRPQCTSIDALKASFPGGSITGVPKIRAMEIISELEGTPRGPYCGAIGYLGFDGTMDTNIAIRTMISPEPKGDAKRQLYYQVGGGIVADSDPEMEYEESLTKAKSFFDLIGRTQE